MNETYYTFGKLRQYLNSENFIMINASEVFNNVCARIGLHPYEVLDEVYAKTLTKAD